jgi:hypothetical protein
VPKQEGYHTQKEITEGINVTRQAVSVWEEEFAKNYQKRRASPKSMIHLVFRWWTLTCLATQHRNYA